MIQLTYLNNILTLEGVDYTIESMYMYDYYGVNLYLVNEKYNTIYTVSGGETTINGILQTSADMIINTLSA